MASFFSFAAARFLRRSVRTATFSGEVKTVVFCGFGPRFNFFCGVAALKGPIDEITEIKLEAREMPDVDGSDAATLMGALSTAMLGSARNARC